MILLVLRGAELAGEARLCQVCSQTETAKLSGNLMPRAAIQVVIQIFTVVCKEHGGDVVLGVSLLCVH